MNGFKPIDRWPSQKIHLRNIEISLEVSAGKSYAAIGLLYGRSRTTIMQIYRILAAKLCERHLGINYHEAVYDKDCYRHKDMQNMLRRYQQDYILWMVTDE